MAPNVPPVPRASSSILYLPSANVVLMGTSPLYWLWPTPTTVCSMFHWARMAPSRALTMVSWYTGLSPTTMRVCTR